MKHVYEQTHFAFADRDIWSWYLEIGGGLSVQRHVETDAETDEKHGIFVRFRAQSSQSIHLGTLSWSHYNIIVLFYEYTRELLFMYAYIRDDFQRSTG